MAHSKSDTPLRQDDPRAPTDLRLHVDGGVYRLLSTALSADDRSPVAIYEHLHPHERGVWTRPLDEFERRFAPLGPRAAAALMAIDPTTRQAEVARRKSERRAGEALAKILDAKKPMSKLYSLGLMFSSDRSKVALIRKATPEWQAGKLNGVGGKAESGESSAHAMAREFHEETGVETTPADWELFARLGSPHFEVHVFRCFDDRVDLCRTNTHEEVVVARFDAAELLAQGVAGLSALACIALERDAMFARLDCDEWADEARNQLAAIVCP